ncbi:hypothetical protein EDB84DRAFT_262653 [Lactarius hengduanensis]|nr:hypothetical protein EDB84DRAFT_262653 [Lactarius hengduanensis]
MRNEAMFFGPDFQDEQGETVATEGRLLGNESGFKYKRIYTYAKRASKVRGYRMSGIMVRVETEQQGERETLCVYAARVRATEGGRAMDSTAGESCDDIPVETAENERKFTKHAIVVRLQGSESLLIQYMHSLFWYRLHEVVILVVGMEMDQEYDEGNICSAFLETTPELHRCELGFESIRGCESSVRVRVHTGVDSNSRQHYSPSRFSLSAT